MSKAEAAAAQAEAKQACLAAEAQRHRRGPTGGEGGAANPVLDQLMVGGACARQRIGGW